ncbi:MAG TPA: ribosome maturation factor RimM [Exilispira sp.]|nr:ribosome maturation factor RimM [Exilispira sp.]
MIKSKGTCVAKITKVFGFKGAVCLEPLTDIKERLYDAKVFFLDEDCTNTLEVDKIEGDWHHLHVFFKGYDCEEKSRNLIGKYLYLTKIDSKDLLENQIFFYEILEYNIEYLPNKFSLANDIYTFNSMIFISLILEGKEYLIPFNKDFIEKIDKEKHIIKIKRFDQIVGN